MCNVSQKINLDVLSFTPKNIINTLLYGNNKYRKDVNTYILNQTINYINKSKRFEKKIDDDQAETWLFKFFLFDFFLSSEFYFLPWVGVGPGEMVPWGIGSLWMAPGGHRYVNR